MHGMHGTLCVTCHMLSVAYTCVCVYISPKLVQLQIAVGGLGALRRVYGPLNLPDRVCNKDMKTNISTACTSTAK